MLNRPSKLFDGDENLSKAGVDSSLSGIKTGHSGNDVLVIQYVSVRRLEMIRDGESVATLIWFAEPSAFAKS
jgi:hypothetical protein